MGLEKVTGWLIAKLSTQSYCGLGFRFCLIFAFGLFELFAAFWAPFGQAVGVVVPYVGVGLEKIVFFSTTLRGMDLHQNAVRWVFIFWAAFRFNRVRRKIPTSLHILILLKIDIYNYQLDDSIRD